MLENCTYVVNLDRITVLGLIFTFFGEVGGLNFELRRSLLCDDDDSGSEHTREPVEELHGRSWLSRVSRRNPNSA